MIVLLKDAPRSRSVSHPIVGRLRQNAHSRPTNFWQQVRTGSLYPLI